MLDLTNFLNEEQDQGAVEKVFNKVKDLLTPGETIEYIAVQKKPAVTISPDSVVLTSKRVIICRSKNLGLSMEFQDFLWKDISDCHMKEGILGAEFSVQPVHSAPDKVDYLPKSQARKLYQFAQQKEEEQHELRRERELEEKRAGAGGVTVNTPPAVEPPEAAEPALKADDPMAVLQKLKMVFDNNLITQEDYDAKKAEVLSRL
ncbi:PH domain-containing protein [Hufsiella ginkgonis]|uniref:YokE-like PH domain-containing protein n=1 Tax=Hufsiella ginkgonis TaxID=2695274 RepID=A0A7K1XV44_9SPHI|nr:PH domain-containing protein [Hufsiella ginkgonis]MXV14376.1 hypothetical protein [Hufsiella ginkgonis]